VKHLLTPMLRTSCEPRSTGQEAGYPSSVKKRLALEASLHEILQVLSVTLFEQTPILQAFGDMQSQEKSGPFSNQLTLWDL